MNMLDELRQQRTMLLTTYRSDGSPVGTPVNVAASDTHAYFCTWATSGKAKRIAKHPSVTLAPSSPRGTQTGPTVKATVRLLHGDEAISARKLITRKYPILQGTLVPLSHRLKKLKSALYELTLDDNGDSKEQVHG
jgi:PPOX class probable F420-dependent enzyme